MARLEWNDSDLLKCAGESVQPLMSDLVEEGANVANALGSDFSLSRREQEAYGYFDNRREWQPPRYAGDVKLYHGSWPVGIIHTDNYAAMIDNQINNTLLKSIG